MISKNMYTVLKKIPCYPQQITLEELREKKILNVLLLEDILNQASINKYISFVEFSTHKEIFENPFCLTEAGQIEIEEYTREKQSSVKATWALILSGISIIVSIVAVIISCSVQ